MIRPGPRPWREDHSGLDEPTVNRDVGGLRQPYCGSTNLEMDLDGPAYGTKSPGGDAAPHARGTWMSYDTVRHRMIVIGEWRVYNAARIERYTMSWALSLDGTPT